QESLNTTADGLRKVVWDEDACIDVDQYRSSRLAFTTVVLMGWPLTLIEALKAVRSGKGMGDRIGGTSRAAAFPRRWITISSPIATLFKRAGRPARASRALTFFTTPPPALTCTQKIYTNLPRVCQLLRRL